MSEDDDGLPSRSRRRKASVVSIPPPPPPMPIQETSAPATRSAPMTPKTPEPQMKPKPNMSRSIYIIFSKGFKRHVYLFLNCIKRFEQPRFSSGRIEGHVGNLPFSTESVGYP